MVCAPTTAIGKPHARPPLTTTSPRPSPAPPRLQLLALKLRPRGGALFALQLAVPLGAFFFNDAATTEIYTLSLHDALPILSGAQLTTVLVACLFAVTTKLPALLRCVVSPL